MKKLVGIMALICILLASGLSDARNPDRGEDKFEGRRNNVSEGRKRGGKEGPHGMQSEAMQKEFKRYREAMKKLRQRSKALKQKIREAGQQIPGEGDDRRRPGDKRNEKRHGKTRMISQNLKSEAKRIATAVAEERIRHHKNTLAIAKREKHDMIKELTNRLLQFHHGGKGHGGNEEERVRPERGRRRGVELERGR